MTVLVITTDLECCKCRAKIEKVLNCCTDEYCIEKVEYENKKNTVVVHGKFDAEKLCRKIRCKAGKCIKDCKPKPQEDEKLNPKLCDCCKPKPCDCCKPKPCDCCKPEAEKKPKNKSEENSKPQTKPEYKLVPYPYPTPYPTACPSWPWRCPPQQHCHSCTPPPPPLPCGCSSQGSCSCGGKPPAVWTPQPTVVRAPPPWGAYPLITEETSSCSTM